MDRHNVKVEDLQEWEQEVRVTFACSYDKGSNKQLCRKLTGNYQVVNHGKVVYEGLNPNTAITEYNKLP